MRKTVCAKTVGLLLVFVERESSSLPNNGSGGGSTITRSTLTHLAGAGRVNLASYSTCLKRLARVVALPAHTPVAGMTTTAMVVGQCRAEEGQGTVQPVICTAGVPAAEMACGMDPGMSVLEGSSVLTNWATDISGMVGLGSGDKAGEAEEVLGTIAGSGGGGGAVASAWGGRQRQ